ncbi:MAG: FAD-dependent oxidoreductase [Nitrospiraceae bacterium]
MAEPTQSATVLHVRPLSPHVREMVLAPQMNPISYKPGQWISVQLPAGSHPPLVRAYSMAEPQSVSGHLVLIFDRVPGGLGTEYLFGLNEGDEVMVSGPYGRFVLPDLTLQDLVFIARYTGIVPIHCMLRHLLATVQPRSLILGYSAPTESELIYHNKFEQWSSGGNLLYLPSISGSKEGLETPVHEWPIIRNLTPHIEKRKDFVPLISGIKAFVRPLRMYFTELGWDRRQIRVETYD